MNSLKLDLAILPLELAELLSFEGLAEGHTLAKLPLAKGLNMVVKVGIEEGNRIEEHCRDAEKGTGFSRHLMEECKEVLG